MPLLRPFQLRERQNLTWFYPRVCRYQDALSDPDTFMDWLDGENTSPRPALLYIHIPFCDSLCAYCPCFKISKHTYPHSARVEFVEMLVREMRLYSQRRYLSNTTFHHVHIGGGTPSCLESDLLASILEGLRRHFNLAPDARISLEGNAISLKDTSKLRLLKDLGVGRVSFGVQTFDEHVREGLRIKASVKDIHDTVEAIAAAGIPALAVDLMYNLPDQSAETFELDIQKTAREVAPSFIQCYRFTDFHNTSLHHRLRDGHFSDLPSPEKEMEQYELALDAMPEAGYKKQLLINVFAKDLSLEETGLDLALGGNRMPPTDVFGLGPGAMSFVDRNNYRTVCSLEQYVERLRGFRHPVDAGNTADAAVHRSKTMVSFPNFLRIRADLAGSFHEYLEIIEALVEEEYCCRRGDEVLLTRKGKLWAGNIAFLFYPQAERMKLQRSFQLSLREGTNPFNQDGMNTVQPSAPGISGKS